MRFFQGQTVSVVDVFWQVWLAELQATPKIEWSTAMMRLALGTWVCMFFAHDALHPAPC